MLKAALFVLLTGVAGAGEPNPARDYFTDTVLVDQNGARLRFYSDVVQGKTVVMHSFFGACHGSCPLLLSRMARLQNMLGDRLGKEVVLISITVDPQADHPERLKALAAPMNPRAGWYLLTGNQQNSETVLKKMFPPANSRDAHDTRFVVFDVRTNRGEKIALNEASPERLFAAVNSAAR